MSQPAGQDPPPTIVRCGGTDDRPLLADIYRPQASGPHPLVIAVSGGGWNRGHRSALAAWGVHLAEHGFAVASIDYRRAVDGPAFPGNADDVAVALAHFGREGAQYEVDTHRIALLGVSAGAHLGAVVTLNDAFRAPRPRAFAGIYGVYDLVTHWRTDAAANPAPGSNKAECMMGGTPYDAPRAYFEASPLHHISYDKALPVYLAWGHQDRDVAPEQSAAFARALGQARYSVSTTELPDAGHLWFSQQDPRDPDTYSSQVAPHLVQFLRDALDVRP